jgi:hypothetical protein
MRLACGVFGTGGCCATKWEGRGLRRALLLQEADVCPKDLQIQRCFCRRQMYAQKICKFSVKLGPCSERHDGLK